MVELDTYLWTNPQTFPVTHFQSTPHSSCNDNKESGYQNLWLCVFGSIHLYILFQMILILFQFYHPSTETDVINLLLSLDKLTC